MKILILLAGLLAVVGTAQAELDHDGISRPAAQQQLSKRPYTAPVEKSVEKYEGDVSNMADVEADKKYKTLQLHSLGRKPYAEK